MQKGRVGRMQERMKRKGVKELERGRNARKNIKKGGDDNMKKRKREREGV